MKTLPLFAFSKPGPFMKRSFLSSMALTGVVFALSAGAACASVISDLGAAAGYSVLTYNSSSTSNSAFQGGPIGVVSGNWAQSGGQATDAQQPTTVYLSSGFKNNGPSVEKTVFDSARLSTAWAAAKTASATFAALAPTDTLGSITSGTTITKSEVGVYVLSISNIKLNQSALTLSAPAGSTFVLNISGDVTLAGGSRGNGLRVGGGISPTDVVYNLTGSDSQLTTSGGGNAQWIQGIVLATGANASVGLHPGGVTGEIIARSFSSSSGTMVCAPPMTVVPETTTVLPLLGVLGAVLMGPMIRRKYVTAQK